MRFKPTIIGSQGFGGLWPENTLAAVRAALAAKVDGIELDFHLSHDGVLVAHHDYRLDADMVRKPDGHWLDAPGPAIKSLSFKDLQAFDVGQAKPGSPTALSYPDQKPVDQERIPSLNQVIDLVESHGSATTEVWVEIKSNPFGRDELVSPTEAYVAALQPFLGEPEIARRLYIISFDWRVLQGIQNCNPDVKTGYLTVDPKWLVEYGEEATGSPPTSGTRDLSRLHAEFTEARFGSLPKAVMAAGGTYWSPFIGDLTTGLVQAADDLGLRVSTWGADDRETMTYALSLGVQSITTSRPNDLMSLRDQNQPQIVGYQAPGQARVT